MSDYAVGHDETGRRIIITSDTFKGPLKQNSYKEPLKLPTSVKHQLI